MVKGWLAVLGVYAFSLNAQPFYFGADLSYVNEMEDCGVVYKEDAMPKDVYALFRDHGCNLVRLRLWHTPAWYDELNAGRRYSDLADVMRSIGRAKAQGMHVLLDFHLSDNWADPGKQVVPEAWDPVVDNLPVLKDSLYHYISSVLMTLHNADLLPEMVQIGNETNKGILQSQEANDGGWVLDWDRNSQLFNTAIEAVHHVEEVSGRDIRIAVHVAGPADAAWLFDEFIENGITDFDVMGISYYWAWHQPTDISDAGEVISRLHQDHPGYEVMIFETGYIWTTQSNDNANNIISSVHPDFAPASPENQREWLVALTQEVIDRGGKGVIYWEPAWVSSDCWTQWGQGSHQEHATFFDFQNNLIPDGGVAWMTFPYENLSSVMGSEGDEIDAVIAVDTNGRMLTVTLYGYEGNGDPGFLLVNTAGQVILSTSLDGAGGAAWSKSVALPDIAPGLYFGTIHEGAFRIFTQRLFIGD